jgi:hypothetical protein
VFDGDADAVLDKPKVVAAIQTGMFTLFFLMKMPWLKILKNVEYLPKNKWNGLIRLLKNLLRPNRSMKSLTSSIKEKLF